MLVLTGIDLDVHAQSVSVATQEVAIKMVGQPRAIGDRPTFATLQV